MEMLEAFFNKYSESASRFLDYFKEIYECKKEKWAMSVSYTHLDVYKRQHTYTLTCARARTRNSHGRSNVIYCDHDLVG